MQLLAFIIGFLTVSAAATPVESRACPEGLQGCGGSWTICHGGKCCYNCTPEAVRLGFCTGVGLVSQSSPRVGQSRWTLIHWLGAAALLSIVEFNSSSSWELFCNTMVEP